MTEQPLTKTFIDVLDSRMAYHERGVGAPVLFLHGNPTSSYLWRNVMSELDGRGRLIAPDLIGMGDSGKLKDPRPDTYRFATHRKYLDAFIDAVIGPSEGILFIVHDWAIGARRSVSTGLAVTATASAPSPIWRGLSARSQAGRSGAHQRPRYSRDFAQRRARA